ncbi:MAG TPA: FAD-binding oxidoreductase [Gammaproteobacteria bacterium]|nr:FAD-binding oxidoreductase [Gammaproteobacteria bacterium]
MKTPPGISEADFAAAIDQFKSAVGAQWVFTSDEDVATYRDAYSPLYGESAEKVASAAVAPETVEQIQQIVRVANRYKIPLYTISTGRNLAYGGSAPVYSGSVVLDLKRMNKVLDVNEDEAYALVEPGVSYFDLYRHIRERGLKLWIDCPDPGWGSPVGNALDHGAGRTPLPYRDHFGSHCGMEVVLANGEVVRTGMGALPKAETWQHFQYCAGPTPDAIFAQSNFGIVTKMGFWLMPEPEASMTGRITVPHHDDVIPFVRTLGRLAFQGVVNCVFSIQSPVFGGPLDADKSALLDRPGGGTAEEWDRYAASKGRGHFWQTDLRFYGPEKVIAAQWEYVKQQMAAIEGAKSTDGEVTRFPLTDDQIERLADPGAFGIPSLNVFSSVQGTAGHLDASPMLPYSGDALLEAHKVFMKLFRDAGLPLTLGFAMSYHWRSFIMFQGINLSHDPAENAKARSLYEQVIKVASDHGWGIYRAHAAFMDTVMEQYSYNDHALMRLNETLKDALDPNGILSAGRYGIWPKHLRGSRA